MTSSCQSVGQQSIYLTNCGCQDRFIFSRLVIFSNDSTFPLPSSVNRVLRTPANKSGLSSIGRFTMPMHHPNTWSANSPVPSASGKSATTHARRILVHLSWGVFAKQVAWYFKLVESMPCGLVSSAGMDPQSTSARLRQLSNELSLVSFVRFRELLLRLNTEHKARPRRSL
jgi:hypothetical protein